MEKQVPSSAAPTPSDVATASPPTPSENRAAMPAFRSFVSVELPFLVRPTITTASPATIHGAEEGEKDDVFGSGVGSGGPRQSSAMMYESDRQAVEAFLPPSFVAPCLYRPTPQQSTVRENVDSVGEGVRAREEEGVSAKERTQTLAQRGGTGEPTVDNVEDDEDAWSARSCDSKCSDSDSDSTGSGAKERSSSPAMKASTQGNAKSLDHRGLKTSLSTLMAHRRHYCPVPIFSGWRSTGAEDDDDVGEPPKGVEDTAEEEEHRRAQKRLRREVFPSTEPQLLLHGYYRNDLLIEVRQRRWFRRYRDPLTNEILREEEMPEGLPEGAAGTEEDAEASTVSAHVLGVVSRELEIARPADFTFGLFTEKQLREAPSLCGADVFPPEHFLGTKALFEARYEPGRESNTAVAPAVSGDDGAPSATQYEFAVLPTISVNAEDSFILPSRTAEHEHFLRVMGSSLDGGCDTDPREVRMVVQLLAERPAWNVRDLQKAMLQSGLCPRPYRNKQVIQCFTYIIRTGPFNRLRLRLGYEPYSNSKAAPYVRVAVRLLRRSSVGVRLRDASRSPYIESVLRLLLERDRVRRAAYKATAEHARCFTMLELQCQTIRQGHLYIAFQPVDAMDDPVVAELMRCVEPVDAPMEMTVRAHRNGWLSETTYTRLMAYYSEALEALLETVLEPLLRQHQGVALAAKKTVQVAARSSSESVSTPSIASSESASEQAAPEEEEEGSEMSAASAGDISDDDDDSVSDGA